MEGESRQLVKEGRVSVVYPERHSVRCEFEDKDGLISCELPVLTTCATANKSYGLPDIGTVVVCLFASNADNTGTGWVLGCRYHDKATPAVDSIDKTRIDFKDGTFIEYDRAKHEMRVECTGNLHINAKNIFLNE